MQQEVEVVEDDFIVLAFNRVPVCRIASESSEEQAMAPPPSPSSCWPSPALVAMVKGKVASMAQTDPKDVRVVVSPYRICPLGAHIDHQGGSVTAMAINQGVLLAFTPSDTLEDLDEIAFSMDVECIQVNDGSPQLVQLQSGQFAGEVKFSLGKVPSRKYNDGAPDDSTEIYVLEEGAWGNFARGAVLALKQRNHKLSKGIVGFMEGSKGFEGCGVSSSAAVGVAFLLALEHANGLCISPEENIELDRLIENNYLGLKNGVLDQSAILLSQQHCLTAIHCLSRKHELVYPPWYGRSDSNHYKILLAFSGLQHALSTKPGYNLRVADCQEAAIILLKAVGRASSEAILSKVTLEEYTTHKNLLEGDVAKRAQHYFTESARVSAGIEAWSAGNLQEFGRLMSESGLSSIYNYECGCEPLVQLRDILASAPGVYGARFSGAGFRGCCVALVATESAEEAAEYVRVSYLNLQPALARQLHNGTAVFICESADKAHVLL